MQLKTFKKILCALLGLILVFGAVLYSTISLTPNNMLSETLVNTAYAATVSAVTEKENEPRTLSATETSVTQTKGVVAGIFKKCVNHKFSTWRTTKRATCSTAGQQTRTCMVCRLRQTRSIPRIGHTYQKKIVQPTCTRSGYIIYTCVRCGHSYRINCAATKHNMTRTMIIRRPTCEKSGQSIKMCTKCGYRVYQTQAPLGHSYRATVTKPTCTEQGFTTYTCIRCNKSYKNNYTKAEHSLLAPEIIIEPTCEKTGLQVQACSSCDYKIETTLPAGEHSYEEVVQQPTCIEKGYVKQICANCKDEKLIKEYDVIAHDFSDWKVVTVASCEQEGISQRTCECGEVETTTVPKLGHDLEEHPAQTATCGQPGWEAYVTCRRCSFSTFKDYITIGHVMGKPYTLVEATCTTPGKKAAMCLNCNYIVESEIRAKGHSYENAEVSPSCTEDGYYIQRCINCADEIKGDTIPALGHSYGNWETEKEPTCIEVGTEKRSCINCGHFEQKDIPEKEHTYKITTIPPTCTEGGYDLWECECGDSFKDNFTSSSHLFEKWYTYRAATCTVDGESRRDCSVCDFYESEVISAVGHASRMEIVPPTCTSEGYTIMTCSCGYEEITDRKEKLPHSYTEWVKTKSPTYKSEGIETRGCSTCSLVEENILDKLEYDERIVAHYTVVDGAVIDLVSDNVMENATVEGIYFRGGKVLLPTSYERASIEMIMAYNRQSTDLPVGNGLSYYGGAFAFQEIANPSNWGMIKTPFGGGWIGTNFTLRPSFNYDKRVLDHGDSYWCLAFDKTESTHALQINDDYVEKAHWSNYINRTFTLSTEHQFKDFIVYADKLTKEEMAEHFAETGIVLTADNKTLVGRVENGITGLGSAFAYTKDSRFAIPEWMETNTAAGTYTVDDGNGRNLGYVISDYVEPILDVDNSKYESVHIIKKPETLPVEYKYALSAVPYPFNVNHDGAADQYDVSWSSSDESIALIIDGLIVPQRTGTVTITATLRGTEMSDSCTMRIVNHETADERKINISANYVSNNGNSFSDTDYEMTTRAIQDAISETHAAGYNHVVFPQINFYATPIDTECYIPSGMTVEFPEGSAFYMMPSEQAKTDGYTYFRMGWGWWSCAVPTDRATAKTDENGKLLGYYCRDAHLIIDQYYGEFYKEDATMNELSVGANEYAWGCVLLSFGKRAEYCSVEIREANCPTGFFITMGGKGNNELVNAAGGTIAADKFVSGWLDDTGTIVENGNWISTPDFYTVSPGASNGMDTLHEYYMGEWEHNVITSTQRLYDILWFDENYELIQANRWQYVDEGYSNKPDGAKYFKISMQQSALPTGTDFYIGLYPDESSRFCEIKNTNIINGADGLASVVGATEACWIHDNYVSGDGLLSGACWSLDLEDGWQGMRGTVIERNIFRKYAYSQSHGEYRGPDSGILALSSGYNTFVVSNYLGSIAQANYNVANTHVINNVVHSMYSGFTSGKPNEIRTKNFAHVYYNIMGQNSNAISANGVVYYYGNNIISTVNLW